MLAKSIPHNACMWLGELAAASSSTHPVTQYSFTELDDENLVPEGLHWAGHCFSAGLFAIVDTAERIRLARNVATPTEVIRNGTILITGDKIEAVGQDLNVPVGVKTIDTEGFIYPGLIDLHDHAIPSRGSKPQRA